MNDFIQSSKAILLKTFSILSKADSLEPLTKRAGRRCVGIKSHARAGILAGSVAWRSEGKIELLEDSIEGWSLVRGGFPAIEEDLLESGRAVGVARKSVTGFDLANDLKE